MKHLITVTVDIPDKHPPLLRMAEHPEDIAMERHGMADGLARIKAFFEERASDFAALVWTYPDSGAEELLELLREDFWTADPATPFPAEIAEQEQELEELKRQGEAP